MSGEVRITVDDREDTTTLKLPDNFYGDVTLVFRAGVLVNTKQTAVRTKQELKTAKDAKIAKGGAEERTADGRR